MSLVIEKYKSIGYGLDRIYSGIFLLLFALSVQAQTGLLAGKTIIGKEPSCDCDSMWKKPDVTEFVQLLEKVTSQKGPVWPGYNMNVPSFVINAGKIINGDHCLGLWKKGKAISFAQLQTTVSMLTPLYSYYLNFKRTDTISGKAYFSTAEHAPDFQNWMQQMNVISAVYMPLDFSKLPFVLPALVKVQLAIHEAFHVEVMLKYWYTGKGNWPMWDKQPDRKKVQLCYTFNDTGRVQIQKELSILADMTEALLENNKAKACRLGRDYLTARKGRYKTLEGVKTILADNKEGDCRTAEAFFELEEGLADYASWTFLYNTGLASKNDLLKRYRARQNDHFYLSGCMLMHTIMLMNKGKQGRVFNYIINSNSVKEGSLFHLFEQQLIKFCAR